MKNFSVVSFIMLLWMILSSGNAFPEGGGNGKDDGLSLMVFPVAVYSTDTGFGGGFAGIKSYRPERLRTSNVQLFALYTEKQQVSTTLKWDHYFPGDKDRIMFDINYIKYPTYFYGIGNNVSNDDPEQYTPEYMEFDLLYERRFRKECRFKTTFFYRNHSLVKSENGGVMRTDAVPWGRGRQDVGLGYSLLWDTRDNLFATKTGLFAQLEYRGSLYQDNGGAFNTISFDVRRFFNPFEGIVFGSMAWIRDTRGNAPYYYYSTIGGSDRLRGIEYERFRDRSLILLQQDFRYRIWGPVGGALFAATGRVSDDVPGLFSGRYHTAYGAGIRYVFNEEENLVIRADIATGADSRGVYFSFNEAF